MTKRSTAVNQAWRKEAVVIAQNGFEKVYYVPSKMLIIATSGAGSVTLPRAGVPDYIQKNNMEQSTAVPSWEEMQKNRAEIRRRLKAQ